MEWANCRCNPDSPLAPTRPNNGKVLQFRVDVFLPHLVYPSVGRDALFLVDLSRCRSWLCLRLGSIARKTSRDRSFLGGIYLSCRTSHEITLSKMSILDSRTFWPLALSCDLVPEPLGFTASNCSWGGWEFLHTWQNNPEVMFSKQMPILFRRFWGPNNPTGKWWRVFFEANYWTMLHINKPKTKKYDYTYPICQDRPPCVVSMPNGFASFHIRWTTPDRGPWSRSFLSWSSIAVQIAFPSM